MSIYIHIYIYIYVSKCFATPTTVLMFVYLHPIDLDRTYIGSAWSHVPMSKNSCLQTPGFHGFSLTRFT